jgi:hypothetical protein
MFSCLSLRFSLYVLSCAQCCLCLLFISYWLVLLFSHNVLFVVPSVACISGLSFLDWSFSFHTMFCLLCPVLPLSLDYHFLIGPSVFTQCSVCCAQYCLCLWIIISWLGLRFSHNVLFVVPSVASVSGWSFLDWSFGFHTMFCLLCPVLPVSLDYQLLIGPSVFTQCSVCGAQCCLCLLVANSWLILGILEAINRRADNKLTKNVKRINIDQQNTTHETKGRATQSSLKTICELMCFGRISSPCSTSDAWELEVI